MSFTIRLWIAAGFATLLKLICAATTLGTVDVASQFHFGKMIDLQSMEWLYTNDRLFNHMPLVGFFSAILYSATHGNPRLFAFFFRLPNIAADLAALYALISVIPLENRVNRWALMLFALSPVSFMVSAS